MSTPPCASLPVATKESSPAVPCEKLPVAPCDNTLPSPSVILVFSGKRKSGKDYVTDLIRDKIGPDKCSILRLSGPLKAEYARIHSLDYNRLLDASQYKEQHRIEMIKWGESIRNSQPDYFCKIVSRGPGSEKPVWIISDARRRSDVDYFRSVFSHRVACVRVVCEDSIRGHRGWVFTPGVDDMDSECGLDSRVDWDFVVTNNNEPGKLEESVSEICRYVAEKLQTER